MNTNEFDDLLKQKFEQHELSYDRSSWENFAKKLPEAKKKGVIPFGWKTATGIAAGLILAISAYTWWHITPKVLSPVVATTAPIKPTLTPATNLTQQELQQPQQEQIISTQAIHHSHKHPNNISNNTIIPASEETITSNTPPINDYPKTSEPIKTFTPKIVENRTVPTLEKRKKENKTSDDFYFNKEDKSIEPETRHQKRTYVSLTGGLNYGALNNGYVAGINTKQVLSNKLFLEGDLMVMSNSSNQTVSQAEFIKYQNSASVGMKPAPIQYVNTNYLYIQFNPTLGFQLMKKVSLGLGADLQTLLGNESTLVYADNQIKTLPGVDVGVTGKTEVAITPRIKAGLLYREGINNFINSSNHYLDRNYLQLQMKFRVFGK